MDRRTLIKTLLGLPAGVAAASLGIKAAAPVSALYSKPRPWFKLTVPTKLPPIAWRKLKP